MGEPFHASRFLFIFTKTQNSRHIDHAPIPSHQHATMRGQDAHHGTTHIHQSGHSTSHRGEGLFLQTFSFVSANEEPVLGNNNRWQWTSQSLLNPIFPSMLEPAVLKPSKAKQQQQGMPPQNTLCERPGSACMDRPPIHHLKCT